MRDTRSGSHSMNLMSPEHPTAAAKEVGDILTQDAICHFWGKCFKMLEEESA